MNAMISRTGAVLSILVILLFTGATLYFHSRTHGESQFNVKLETLPRQFGIWNGIDADPLTAKSHDILRLDQYVRRMYRDNNGHEVFVYIGYWEKQSGEHQAAKHSPLMCLPANGWKISSPQLRSIEVSSADPQPARQLVGVISDSSVLFYYWFFSGEENYVDETDALFHIMHETIVKGRSDGGIVEISLQMDQSKSAEETLKDAEAALTAFVHDFAPVLRDVVSRNKNSPQTAGAESGVSN